MTEFKKQKEFPLLKRYKKKFDVTDRTIFAYDGVIYCNYDLPRDLLIHEMTHLIQQEEMGVDTWVENYLDDIEFRLQMEIEAYRQQIISFRDRNDKAKCRIESAYTLSSPLYGSIISFEEALKKLK